MEKKNNIFRIIWNEFVYGAHLTALASMALVLSVIILMDIEINIIAILLAYLTTFIVYSFNYQKELDDDIVTDREKTTYLNNRKKIFPYIIYAYIIIAIILLGSSFYLYGNFGFIAFIIILLSGGILYTIVFKILTRTIPGFKSVYTTALWAYAGSTYVYFFNSLSFNWFCAIMFAFMFVKILINAIYFDIKDIQSDKKYGLKTIPILLGRKNTITLLHGMNIFSLFILFYGVYMKFIPFFSISLAIFFIYTESYLIIGNTADQKNIVKYTQVMPDAEYILWPIILIITKLIFYGKL